MDAANPAIAGTDWTDQENDLLVADYFAMFAEDAAGRPFVKTHRYRAMADIIGRSWKAIEQKHTNVSAVMLSLGLPRARGLPPSFNAQFGALTRAIDRYLSINPAALEPSFAAPVVDGAYDPFVAMPDLRARRESTAEPIQRLARKFDPVARDARNRELGKRGEEFVFEQEKRLLTVAGRDHHLLGSIDGLSSIRHVDL